MDKLHRMGRVGWISTKEKKPKEKIWGERNKKTFTPPHKKGGK